MSLPCAYPAAIKAVQPARSAAWERAARSAAWERAARSAAWSRLGVSVEWAMLKKHGPLNGYVTEGDLDLRK